MLRDDLITRILRRVGQRETDTTLRNQLIDEIQDIQVVLETGVKCGMNDQGAFYPWFLYKEAVSAAFVTETMPLPSDFIEEYDEGHGTALSWSDGISGFSPILKDSLDVIKSRYSESGSASPVKYAIAGTNLYLRPYGATGNLHISYYAKEPVLSTNIENAWLTNGLDVMRAELGAACGELVSNQAFRTEMQRQSKVARDRMYAAHVSREEAARQRQRGDD